MIRVLRIINRFNLGGPTYNATFLTAFLPDEFETRLIGGKHEAYEGDSLFIPEKYGVKPELLPELQREISFKNDREALRAIRRIIREFKPHIVHTHASKSGAVGRMAAHKEKVPVIIHTFHGHVFHSYFGKLKTLFYKRTERWLARKSDAIIAISDLQKHELTSIHRIVHPDKVRVIPLGFDLEPFSSDKEDKRKSFRKEWGVSEEEVVIALIGRLTSIKNHSFFLRVIERVASQTNVPVKAFIIGDGELMNDLRVEAGIIEERLGKKLFVFTSWIKNVSDILPGLDVVALTSLNEGTPVSLIEAQAAGVPVITTGVGGVRDIMDDGNTGYIIRDFNENEFVSKLLTLTDHEEIRQKMSQNGWTYVKEKYSYVRLCADIADLYYELLDKKGINVEDKNS